MSVKTRGRDEAPGPTDLELMLYADGELEGERLAAVEACIQRDAVAQAKLRALHLVSGMVQERATDRAADGIADAVMARIGASRWRGPGAPPTPPVRASDDARHPNPRGANDNARVFYLVAGFVVAAAAVVMLWRSPIRAGHGPLARGVVEDEMAATSPSGPDAHRQEADVEHGVEVSSVDFGSGNGAVFYVPNGASGTTTVVWLTDDEDDAAGEEP